MGISQNRLAIECRVPARRINEVVLGRRSMTADTALRIAKFFGNSAEFWLGLQADYDIEITREHIASELAQIAHDPLHGLRVEAGRD